MSDCVWIVLDNAKMKTEEFDFLWDCIEGYASFSGGKWHYDLRADREKLAVKVPKYLLMFASLKFTPVETLE